MDSVLRDIDRESSKMRTDIDNLYRHYEKLQRHVSQYIEETTIEWASLVATHPKTLLLIVETTRIVDEHGYAYGDSEPIRFTTLSLTDGGIWDQLLHPTHSKGVQGSEYHGLTQADLSDKPRLADAWPGIGEQFEGRQLLIFGRDWARNALRSVIQKFGVLDGAFCLHNRCKEYYGQFYELSLEKVLSYQGISKRREQLTDSRERILMLAQVVRNLAAGMPKQDQEEDEGADDSDLLGELDAHPF